ncbi:MAG: DUF2721 domain-containing protein [bacterium]
MGQELSVIQLIQLILAPAVMINACGLLLLGTSNKYTAVLTRIRLLNEEKRKLFKKAAEKSFEENLRFESLIQQIRNLMIRARLVRNAVICYSGAIALFILTSMLIGLSFFAPVVGFEYVVIATFLFGILIVFCGVIYALLDARRAFDVIQFDVLVDE